jgi:hypothetical protein
MTDLPRPEVILTHEGDLDGLLSGLLLRRLALKLFETEIPVRSFHNNTWRQRPLLESAAWVSDLTFEPWLDRPNWLIVDHHATELRPRFARLVHDRNKSAAWLCYELCRQAGLACPALDRLVHLSNVADLFLVDDADFVLASDYANLVKTYQFWNLYELIEGNPERLLDHPLLAVMAVKRRVEDPVGLAWSRSNVTPISPEVGLVDVVVGNVNLIVHRLLEEKATPYPVLVTLLRRGGGPVIASFRSRDGQALKVAERFKGGGHANAAGATLPRSVQQMPDAVDYLRRVLNPVLPASPAAQGLGELLASLERPES